MGFAVDTVTYMKRNKTNLSYLSCTIIRFLREKSQKRKKVQLDVNKTFQGLLILKLKKQQNKIEKIL